MKKIEQFQEILNQSKQVAFFGGAGVSTASGIPDFRSSEGLFVKGDGQTYPPESIVSHEFFLDKPKVFFDYYFKYLVHQNAQPNEVHDFLSNLEASGKEVAIITQNIDGLHQKAGLSKVYELHGSVWRNYCLKCGRSYQLNKLKLDKDGIPRCSQDGEIVRPDVTLYQESLNQEVFANALSYIQSADTLIIAGTSLAVFPAAQLIHYFNGDHLIVVNKTPINVNHVDALVFQGAMESVFANLEIGQS